MPTRWCGAASSTFSAVASINTPRAAERDFLRGRPDRRPPQSLEDAREEVELFHAYADAGLWNEADSTFVALDNPKHRFLAPAFERDLLLRFFPDSDWRQPPLWPGFGRYRSLAICFELLGQFDDAIVTYRSADAPLRGDALIALGRLQPFLEEPQAAHPWQTLWQAYRAHALCLLGRPDEACERCSSRRADGRLRMGSRFRVPASPRQARHARSRQPALSRPADGRAPLEPPGARRMRLDYLAFAAQFPPLLLGEGLGVREISAQNIANSWRNTTVAACRSNAC